jgi:hypothetical protein
VHLAEIATRGETAGRQEGVFGGIMINMKEDEIGLRVNELSTTKESLGRSSVFTKAARRFTAHLGCMRSWLKVVNALV